MSKYGNINHGEDWNERPLKKYLEYKKTRDNITEDRYNNIRNTLAESPASSTWQSWEEFVDWRSGMTVEDGWDFLEQLRASNELSERTVAGRMGIVQSFLSKLMERSDTVDSNPVAFVLDETDFEIESTPKIERSVAEVGQFLQQIKDHEMRALGCIFAKTGVRLGENTNIDLPFVHLQSEPYYDLLDKYGVTIHKEIRNTPDSIYIPTEPTIGEIFRGEERQGGNKRERGTVIPIDKELKQALLDWVALRPETAYPHPLWTSPEGNPNRISKVQIRQQLTRKWPERTGFVDDGSTREFTPHWFRHFFTTNMKPGMGHHDDSLSPSLVKFIRGDIEDDIMEVYTHSWGDQVREQYIDAIYHFGIYD